MNINDNSSKQIYIYRNSNAEDAVHNILTEQLPRIQELMTKGELTVENMDVFCEKVVTKSILENI